MQLSRGSINSIVNLNVPHTELKPVMQILSIKALYSAGGNATQRYRFVLYDGQEQVTAMLATQLNHLIVSNDISENSSIRLEEFAKSTIGASAVVIILRLTVVGQASPPQPQQQQGLPQTQQGNQSGNISGPASVAGTQQQSQHTAYGAPQGQYHVGATTGVNPNMGGYQQNNSSNNNSNMAFNKPQMQTQSAPNYGNQGNSNNNNNYGAGNNQNMNNNAPHNNSNSNVNNIQRQQQQNVGMGSGPAPVPAPYGGSAAQAYKPISRLADSGGLAADAITPIDALSPYSNKWTIKARVTVKAEVKSWSNAKGEGKFFSIDLLDANNNAIRAMFWKDACEKYYPIIEESKVYTFSGGKIKQVANQKFSTIKNDYELDFGVNADIRPCIDDGRIKSQTFSFVKIRDVQTLNVDSFVDVIAVVRSFTEAQEIISKNQGGKTIIKRDVVIVDDTMTECRVTLWGEKAQTNLWADLPIVAFKGVKIGEYNGRNLGTVQSTVISINPDLPEAYALYNWKLTFGQEGIPIAESLTASGGDRSADFNIERRKPIACIRDEGLGLSEKGDYLTICGYIQFIKKDGPNPPWYPACQTCNKKAIEGMGGQWSCEVCNKQFDQPIRRYLINLQMQDYSGNSWFSLFDESGQKLFGVSADFLEDLRSNGSEVEMERIYDLPLFRMFTAKVKVKQEMVQEEARIKSSILQIQPIDFVQQNKSLLGAIARYN